MEYCPKCKKLVKTKTNIAGETDTHRIEYIHCAECHQFIASHVKKKIPGT